MYDTLLVYHIVDTIHIGKHKLDRRKRQIEMQQFSTGHKCLWPTI